MDCWQYLPDHILLHIMNYLRAEDILTCTRVCYVWRRVARDEMLWKALLKRDWKIDLSLGLSPDKSSWYKEYLRLWQHTPMLETEVLKGHTHQVLHVSFSHNGKYFATCSKDGYILLWDSGYPARIKHYNDMKVFSWKNTQYSQFNESDTLLLVSGVHFGTHSNTGEIAVFSIGDEFVLQCRMFNKPYDFFGTWYNDNYLLSGDLQWLAHLVSTSIIWLNKASQESESEYISIMNRMFKFYNRSASSIRAITVANCIQPQFPSSPSPSLGDCASFPGNETAEKITYPEKSNSESVQEDVPYDLQHHFHSRRDFFPESSENGAWGVESDFQFWRRHSDTSNLSSNKGCDINGDDNVDEVDEIYSGNAESKSTTSDTEDNGISSVLLSGGAESYSHRAESVDSAESEDILDNREKFLIFTMGSQTYTPHQIGLKRVPPFTFCRRIDLGPSLAERVATRVREREAIRQAQASGIIRPEPAWQDYEAVAHRFDRIDHIFDLNGHIIGMGLSPDHRYLYVNVRPWPKDCVIGNPLQPPPIAQEIYIHVIDLVTLKKLGTLFHAHRAYTPNDECFFIFLDVSDNYVASGAEDKHGYLWDRHYGTCLARYPHSDVVNSVAFNPRDPEMLITASDDYTLKIWRSRSSARHLGLKLSDLPKAEEYRRRKR